jgi:hypothetical protein
MSWICVALRLFVRFRVVRAPGWDDLLVVLSLVRPFLRLGSCPWVLPLVKIRALTSKYLVDHVCWPGKHMRMWVAMISFFSAETCSSKPD